MFRTIFAVLLLLSFSSSVLADVPPDVGATQCGMEEAADGTLQVKSADPTICEDDLAFAGLYVMFSDVFQDSAVKPFVLWFVDETVMNSEFVQFADETLPISDSIYAIMAGTALVSWSIMGILVFFKGFMYGWQFMRTGKKPFSQQTGDDGVKLIVYLGVLIFLSAPVGFSGGRDGDKTPLMAGQALAVVLSLPATNVGNIGYSTFLASSNMASTDAGLKENELLLESQPVANAMISSQLCQVNTALGTFNNNSIAESAYFAKAFWGVGDVGFDTLDQEHIMERFDQCTGYVAQSSSGEVNDTVESVMFNKGTYDYRICQGAQYNYDRETFGFDHTCGSLTYNLGESKFLSMLDREHSEAGDDNDDLLESLHDSIDPGTLFRVFRSSLLDPMRRLMSQEGLSPQERFKKAQELVLEESESLKNRGLGHEILRSGTVEERQLFHLYAGVAMLGGKVRNYSEMENFTDSLEWFMERQTYPSIHFPEPREGVFWFEMLNGEARTIAELVREYHCAVNWGANADTRMFITSFNRNDDAEQLREMFDGGKVPFQCIRLMSEDYWDRNNDFKRYMTYHLDHRDAFFDLKQDSSGTWRVDFEKKEAIADKAEEMRTEVADELQIEIKARQLILAGYVAAVKKAIADSLEESAGDIELDSIRDTSLRGMGWGVLGGALLYTGQNSSSSRHMGSSFSNIIMAGASDIQLNGVNMQAFGPDFTEDQMELLATRFPSMGIERFMTVGSETAAVRSSFQNTEAASEEEAMQQFLRYVEYLFLSPVSHIKEASGMPVDRSLGDGLRFCFENGAESCLSGTKHPITALSHFGNEMFTNGLSMIIGLTIIEQLFGNVDFKSQKASIGGEKSAAQSFLKQALKFLVKLVGSIVTILIEIVSLVIDVVLLLKPILMAIGIGMTVVGFIFAFLLPMLAYLYGFMVLLLFFVSVFLTPAVLPFYLVYKFINLDKEYSNGIQLLYRDFFGPFMTPILYVISSIIAWSLMVIGLYLFNFSYSILHEGLGASYAGQNGTMMGLVFNVMLYMLYFFGLFVYLRFLLQLMKSLQDKAKEKLNLSPSNDGQFMDSLGFENYIQARVVGDAARALSRSGTEANKEMAKNLGFSSYSEMINYRNSLKDMVDENREAMRFAGLGDPSSESQGKGSANSDAVKASSNQAEEDYRQDDIPAEQSENPAPDDASSSDSESQDEDMVYSSGANPDGKPDETHSNPKDAMDHAEKVHSEKQDDRTDTTDLKGDNNRKGGGGDDKG